MPLSIVVWDFRGGHEAEWETCLKTLCELLDLFNSDFSVAFRQAMEGAKEAPEPSWGVPRFPLGSLIKRAKEIMLEMPDDVGCQNPGLIEYQGPAMLVSPWLREQLGDPLYWTPSWFYSSHSGSTAVFVDCSAPVSGARLILCLGEGEEGCLQSSFLGDKTREWAIPAIRRICPERRVLSTVDGIEAVGIAPFVPQAEPVDNGDDIVIVED